MQNSQPVGNQQNNQNRQQGQNPQKAQFGQPYPSSNKNSQSANGQPNKPVAPWVSNNQAPKTPVTFAPASSVPHVSTCNSGRMFIMGVIIGMVIIWVWGDARKSPQAENEQATPKEELGIPSVGVSDIIKDTAVVSSVVKPTKSVVAIEPVSSNSTITLSAIQPAGSIVAIDNISSKDSVWAVVYEYNDNTFGRVLGAARFFPNHTSGTIELGRATLPNLQYFVGLVADVESHSYTAGKNAPLIGADGKRVGSVFIAK